jgi:two-component system, chemotaxis family, chemotaxis protein CheY
MKRVLVADDSGPLRKTLRHYLEKREGFSVCEASDGLQAVEKAKEFRPDLVVLDLAMPQLNGVEAASIIKHEMPEVPIILFTIYGETGGTLAAATGVNMVVDKAEGARSLMQHVDKILAVAPRHRSGGPAVESLES